MYDDFDLQMVRGDDRTVQTTVQKPDGSGPEDVSGWTFRFTARTSLLAPDPFIEKSLGSGIAVPNPTLGTVLTSLVPADTAPLTKIQTVLWCDVEATDGFGKKATVAQGRLTITIDMSA